MNHLLKYAPGILIVLFIGFYFFNESYRDKKFQERIQQIESARSALEDSVKALKFKTIERDKVLRDVLRRNLEIIDTLNLTLKRLNAQAGTIDKQIEKSKKNIDELWKNN